MFHRNPGQLGRYSFILHPIVRVSRIHQMG